MQPGMLSVESSMHLLITICQQKAAQLVYLVGKIDESMDDGDVFMDDKFMIFKVWHCLPQPKDLRRGHFPYLQPLDKRPRQVVRMRE